jgi:transposase
MNGIIKQCFGIDVSKDEFDVTIGTYDLEQTVQFIESQKFKNNLKGFKLYLKWSSKLEMQNVPAIHVMEATGVYHEKLACFLVDASKTVTVVLPTRASAFARSLQVKTITDKEASRSLCRMGLEKKMPAWSKPDPLFAFLRKLSRERTRLQKIKAMLKNQKHSESHSAWEDKGSIKRTDKILKLLKEQISELEKHIKEIIDQNPLLKEKINKLTSIPGVGITTAASVVGETNGFAHMENKRQMVSYSGFDVVRKDSGTSVHSKPRISKRGNRHVRKAMHFPALTAIRHSEPDKVKFTRLVQKHGIKMKAAVAVQRKILVTMFTLWKKDEFYDPQYMDKKKGQLALP